MQHQRRTMGLALTIGIASMLLLLTGCTTVSITDATGTTRVQRYFGVVSIELAPTTTAVVAETRSFGYQNGPMGMTLGAGLNRIAALPKACHLVVWIEHPEQIEALQQMLADRNDLCAIYPRKEE